jgi:protein involved in polysaccharide export with SLBB domain
MRAWILLSLGLLLAPGVAAQSADPFISSGREMSRADLQAYLDNLEQTILDDSQGESLREQARARAELIRQRLEAGDFRVGDRIQVQVSGENWTNQSPGAVPPPRPVAPQPGMAAVPTGQGSVGVTFAVQSGPSVKLPNIPDISLRGVLRSELEEYLTEQLSQYIRDPQVSAQSLIRVSIFGSVGAPGFYYPGAEQNVGDVIMMAGGPAADANYEEIRIKRGDDQLWGGDELQAVMAEGRTLDQLNFLAGDIIEVPQRAANNMWVEVGRIALIVGSTLLLGIRVF